VGENVQQENDDLLIHSEYANVSITLFFHISKMPELGGRPGYIYRTISMVDEAEKLKIDEIEKERQKLATAYHLSIDDVKPITAQAAELLKTPLNGIAN
jgi:hypothetical protein